MPFSFALWLTKYAEQIRVLGWLAVIAFSVLSGYLAWQITGYLAFEVVNGAMR